MTKSRLIIVSAMAGLVVFIGLLLMVKKEGKTISQVERIKKYAKYDKPGKFSQYFKDITTPIGQDESGYLMNYRIEELNKAQERLKRLKKEKSSLNWIERGPANVGGRTRALIVDPDDANHKTWIVGASSGGIWKTTDAGENWTNLSDKLTNLSVNALAMAESNKNVIYAGTGESFPGSIQITGNGIWKSTDRGITWAQLASTTSGSDFAFVNRLVVDPANENIVVAATERGILKTTNGGQTWTKVYTSNTGVEDLVAKPGNFNVLFAGEYTVGVIKSADAGQTWQISSEGLSSGTRFELAISPVNTNYMFVSANVSKTASHVFMSEDGGATWKKFNDEQAFLSSQGDYDNAIAAHPYNEKEVFVGGVDMWRLNFNGNVTMSEPQVRNTFAVDAAFISFVNFGGKFFGGGMSTDDGTNRVDDDWVPVEIRFGPGLKQKAHRFRVPENATSGVTPQNYTYTDYVDVPFQVWDTKNNRQLMVSFRDQEADGVYNLYQRTGENYGQLGREYIFVNAIPYDASLPSAQIATSGGHLFKCLYMFWPTLTPGEVWTPNNLPVSKIIVNYGRFALYSGVKLSVADSYGSFSGPNRYDQGAGYGKTFIPGLHPDHHAIKLIPNGGGNFTMINANDGGLAISLDNASSFSMKLNKYITTQFYGIARHPSANRYIGGTQDNGTWQSPQDVDPGPESYYLFRIGGDGFECLWHTRDPNLLLGSIYDNQIRKSTNSGASWGNGSSGIVKDDGPFITRLSASKDNPDLVFAVGNSGVYRSTNFGSTWNYTYIPSFWVINSTVSSSNNVEVSLANGNIVWAGGGMSQNAALKFHVSTDEGQTFRTVNDYALVSMNAYTSGISTHPIEDSTAFALFSLRGKPKVLRTRNLGQNWEDISGFENNGVSSRGFPDVVVHSLIVMPHNPNIIWVGTDIGLVESTDNGLTWNLADNGLPPVSVYEMHIFGNQVVIGTHGRGIWSVDIPEIDRSPYITDFNHVNALDFTLKTNFKVAFDSVRVFVNKKYTKSLKAPATGVTTIAVQSENYGTQWAYLIGYLSGSAYKSNTIDVYAAPVGFEDITRDNMNGNLVVYPNPGSGDFNLKFSKAQKNVVVQVFALNGMLLYFNKFANETEMPLDLNKLGKGTYLLNIKTEAGSATRKIIIR
jgi:photosystem II stability/assembly factor-like uncharacterized protein